MTIRTDYSILRYLSDPAKPVEPTVAVEEQEVRNVLYGPDGSPVSYLVANRKLPIGYQKEPK